MNDKIFCKSNCFFCGAVSELSSFCHKYKEYVRRNRQGEKFLALGCCEYVNEQIFKIQRSLYSSDDRPKLLVYNENRSLYAEIVASREILDEIFYDNEIKKYVWGTINEEGVVQITKEAEEQNW